MQVQLWDQNTNSTSPIEVKEEVFSVRYNEPLIHQVVVAYQAGSRAGTKKQKTRAEVSGGGAKPFKQKGTGRARAGTTRGPIWRTGGVTFAAVPRDHGQKVNKKMYRLAMKSIVSELIRESRLLVVETLSVQQPKTKSALALFNTLKLQDAKSILLITEEMTEQLYFAVRNLFYVGLTDVSSVDPVSLVRYEKVVMTTQSLRKFEESYQ